jgi:hypothetical protein
VEVFEPASTRGGSRYIASAPIAQTTPIPLVLWDDVPVGANRRENTAPNGTFTGNTTWRFHCCITVYCAIAYQWLPLPCHNIKIKGILQRWSDGTVFKNGFLGKLWSVMLYLFQRLTEDISHTCSRYSLSTYTCPEINLLLHLQTLLHKDGLLSKTIVSESTLHNIVKKSSCPCA